MRQFLFFLFTFFFSFQSFGQVVLYDTTMTELENIENGYIKNFKVNNHRFRLLFDTTYYNYKIQRLDNKKWVNNLTLEIVDKFGYSMGEDLNADSCNDITIVSRYRNEYYLFNKQTNKFNEKALLITDYKLLDRQNNLFCENTKLGPGSNEGRNVGYSGLFVFKNYRQYYFYYLQYYLDKQANEVQTIVLYKCLNGQKEKRIKLKEFKPFKNEDWEFDAEYSENYWRKNYKELMGYSQH